MSEWLSASRSRAGQGGAGVFTEQARINPEELSQLVAGPPGEATMMAALELTMWLIIGIAAIALVFYLVAIIVLCQAESRRASQKHSQSQRSRPTQPLSAAPAATGSLAHERFTAPCQLAGQGAVNSPAEFHSTAVQLTPTRQFNSNQQYKEDSS
jgi:uncharacterized membrane protein